MELLRVLLMGKKRPAKVQKWVEERARTGVCLNPKCTRSSCEPGGGRGLCAKHFQQFRRTLINRPLEEKMAMELKAIRAGEILDAHEIRTYQGDADNTVKVG